MSKQQDAALVKNVDSRPSGKSLSESKAVVSTLGAVGVLTPIVFTIGFVAQGFLRTDLRLLSP
jgi:hypothetical protein